MAISSHLVRDDSQNVGCQSMVRLASKMLLPLGQISTRLSSPWALTLLTELSRPIMRIFLHSYRRTYFTQLVQNTRFTAGYGNVTSRLHNTIKSSNSFFCFVYWVTSQLCPPPPLTTPSPLPYSGQTTKQWNTDQPSISP
jgi:hypothetical protein